MRDTQRIEQSMIRRTVLTPTTLANRRQRAADRTLAGVLDHCNRAPAAATGQSELRRLRLKLVELRQLEAFLQTLSGSVNVGGPAAARSTQ